MNKVLCIGHTTHDTFLLIERADIYCNVNRKECSVCFGFGDKVPVEKAVYGIGGGAANVSAGLAKLGLAPYLYTYLGNDNHGKFLRKELKKHKISIELVEEDKIPTDSSVIISYDTDRTIFTYNHDRTFGYPKSLDGFDTVFVSSIGGKVSDVYDAVKEYKRLKPRALVAFTPGSKELSDSIDDVRSFVYSADIFIGNIEEGIRVFNSDLERSDVVLQDLLMDFHSKFNVIVVLTDGAKGVYICENGKFHHLESIPMKVIEKTGAGDAFASGFLAGKIGGKTSIESAKWGIANSISMMQRYGAHEGLLSKENILGEVKKYWPN